MTSVEDPQWLALSKERRDALLEKYRNTNVEYVEWWTDVYERFDEELEEKGVYVDRLYEHVAGAKFVDKPAIYFSGFWGQGDGACFEGRVSDWHRFLIAAGFNDLAELYLKNQQSMSLEWGHRGHYYHSGCTSFTSELFYTNPHDEEDDPFQHGVWNQIYKDGTIFEDLEEDFIKYVRSLMDDLYTTLEEEHDHLTSDEAVVEYILDHCEEELVEEDEDELSLEH